MYCALDRMQMISGCAKPGRQKCTLDFRYAIYSSECVGSSRRYRLYTRTADSWGMPGCIRNFCRSIY